MYHTHFKEIIYFNVYYIIFVRRFSMKILSIKVNSKRLDT